MKDGGKFIKIWDSMEQENKNWESLWQECADWCMPRKDNITGVNVAGQEKNPQRMTDICIEANYKFGTGMFSHMFPTGSIWAKFKHPDPEIMANVNVADHFERASRAVHAALTSSNFAQEMQEALMDLGCFGTNDIYVEEDDETDIRFKAISVSNFRIMTDNKGRVDTVGRKLSLDCRQMMQEFTEEELADADLLEVKEKVAASTEASKDKYEIIHLVMPRKDRDPSKINKENKPWASLYICKKNGSIIRDGGYDYKPHNVGRFLTGNGEAYGRSPMSMALATARRTNVIYRSLIVAAESHANPQWLLPSNGSTKMKGHPNRAGSILYWDVTNPANKPEKLQANGDPMIAKDMLEMHREAIKKSFFNDLFRPLDEYRNMTAYEANQRVSTDLMSISPFVSRFLNEVVSPMLQHVYSILVKRGVIPEAPPEIDDFEIEYVSKLSLATKNFEVAGAFQTLQMFSDLAAKVPAAGEAFMGVDFNRLFRQSWHANSGSMNALRSPKETEEIKAAAAAQAEQAQKMQQIPMLADAAQKMSSKPEPGSVTSKMMGGE